MRRLKYISLLILMFVSFTMSALKWHDDLIRNVVSNDNVDKNIVIERHNTTKKIIQASYKITIPKKEKSVIAMVRKTLLDHSDEASKFSYDKDKILFQTIERPSTVYMYRLSTDASNHDSYELIISVEQTR
ncbi:MAG: hypothetical protein J1E78_04165 [Muribaculaceae bacterium]|nr:hypothetical protein [Muribaculaceae bacterium]